MNNLFDQLQEQGASPALIGVVRALVAATGDIAQRVRRGALADILGATHSENVQGETQQRLDVIANTLVKDYLLRCPAVALLASEEEAQVVPAHQDGKYLVAFDPLDGSSNIDINAPIGTIFSIYPVRKGIAIESEAQFQQPGRAQVCAGYVLYGPSTLLMITLGRLTQCYTLNPTDEVYRLTADALQIPPAAQEFAINMSNAHFWQTSMQAYVNDLVLGETGPRGKRFNMRWSAAMVGDVHRILIRGGIFLYPSDSRNAQQPAKLRLLYEANPMALLVETAGGKAWTEHQPILDTVAQQLHQRVPVILGAAQEVDACLGYVTE